MCFFNFTIQALPVRALFILYVAVCCVYNPVRSTTFGRLLTLAPLAFSNGTPFRVGVNNTSFKVGTLALSIFLFFKLLTLSKAYNLCKKAFDNDSNLSNYEALQQMAELKNTMQQSVFFWRGYGNLLLKTKNNNAATIKFNNALNYTSNPDLLMELGNCYTKLGKFSEAEQVYFLAANIEPHRFKPKYGLMKIYCYAKDSVNAKGVAKEIIAMNPKVASEKLDYYKKEASKLIEN
jgi:tetratricopeptide (TPR) repeat protein